MTKQRTCDGCGKLLDNPSFYDMLMAELEYRENYLDNWYRYEEGRLLVCDDCYDKMASQEPPDEWEAQMRGLL